MSDGAIETQAPSGASSLRVGAALGGIVLAAVVVFSLGVMVGKRVAESVPAVAPPPLALPTETVPPLPVTPQAPVSPIPSEKLTFYDRLSGVAPAAPVAPAEGPSAPQAGAPAVPTTRSETAAPREGLKRQPEAKAPLPAAPARAAAPAVAKAAPIKEEPAAQIRKLAGRGHFAVQVAAVNERAAAEETAARVKRLGFEALTVMASVKGKIWYRIRVGSFPSKQAAAQAARIFQSAYGLNAIAVQE